ncbi:type II toxin-antitoxin system VapB family antitoxin [Aquibium sp. ELW1220]|uniref:type II toxin-antitoxin system VapB family antitoxin n=1 Tax=Aquibium sp. ELW1220 TaxID=2976766 RepID=UPI0025B24F0A|nr:type II toxin-antitoxin system VapB family antitoxin [Aquibium sp. ELW1220]MDN2580323.1 type II toxin-antitoxin system VapB family antitoxin [Aquibium sp. ELW1220]
MAFHVRDPKADALVREVARQRGLGITETIREVFEEVLMHKPGAGSMSPEELRDRLQPLIDRVQSMPKTGVALDKAFYDELWGQGDD